LYQCVWAVHASVQVSPYLRHLWHTFTWGSTTLPPAPERKPTFLGCILDVVGTIDLGAYFLPRFPVLDLSLGLARLELGRAVAEETKR
jgi:hypothetical protein